MISGHENPGVDILSTLPQMQTEQGVAQLSEWLKHTPGLSELLGNMAMDPILGLTEFYFQQGRSGAAAGIVAQNGKLDNCYNMGPAHSAKFDPLISVSCDPTHNAVYVVVIGIREQREFIFSDGNSDPRKQLSQLDNLATTIYRYAQERDTGSLARPKNPALQAACDTLSLA